MTTTPMHAEHCRRCGFTYTDPTLCCGELTETFELSADDYLDLIANEGLRAYEEHLLNGGDL